MGVHTRSASQRRQSKGMYFISTPVLTKAEKRKQRKIKQRLLEDNPETLNYDHQSDVQFYTNRAPLWKWVCLEFYESTHQLGDTGKPVLNPNPKATVEQLCVPKFDDSGVYVAISFYDTGIIMVQGDTFLSFADNFSHLQERVEELHANTPPSPVQPLKENVQQSPEISDLLSSPPVLHLTGNISDEPSDLDASSASSVIVTDSMLPPEEQEDASVILRRTEEQLLLVNQQLDHARNELQSQKSDNKILKLQLQLKDEDLTLKHEEIIDLKTNLKTVKRESVKLKNSKEAMCKEKVSLKRRTRLFEEEEDGMKVMIEALTNKIRHLEDDNAVLRGQLESLQPQSGWNPVTAKRQSQDRRTMSLTHQATPSPSKSDKQVEGHAITTVVGFRPNKKQVTASVTAKDRKRTPPSKPKPKPATVFRPNMLRKRVTVLGSSILRGTGTHLHLDEHDACVMVNPGAKIEDMTRKVTTQCAREDIVVLHCGGNNANADSPVELKAKYDALLEEVSSHCPDARVILSGVTQRQGVKPHVRNNIRQLNNYLRDRAAEKPHQLHFLNNSNIGTSYLRRDGVHLIADGTRLLSQNIAAAVRQVAKDVDFPVLSPLHLRG